MSMSDFDLRLRIESDLHELYEQHGWDSDQLDEFIAPIIDEIKEKENEDEEEEDESE